MLSKFQKFPKKTRMFTLVKLHAEDLQFYQNWTLPQMFSCQFFENVTRSIPTKISEWLFHKNSAYIRVKHSFRANSKYSRATCDICLQEKRNLLSWMPFRSLNCYFFTNCLSVTIMDFERVFFCYEWYKILKRQCIKYKSFP